MQTKQENTSKLDTIQSAIRRYAYVSKLGCYVFSSTIFPNPEIHNRSTFDHLAGRSVQYGSGPSAHAICMSLVQTRTWVHTQRDAQRPPRCATGSVGRLGSEQAQHRRARPHHQSTDETSLSPFKPQPVCTRQRRWLRPNCR